MQRITTLQNYANEQNNKIAFEGDRGSSCGFAGLQLRIRPRNSSATRSSSTPFLPVRDNEHRPNVTDSTIVTVPLAASHCAIVYPSSVPARRAAAPLSTLLELKQSNRRDTSVATDAIVRGASERRAAVACGKLLAYLES